MSIRPFLGLKKTLKRNIPAPDPVRYSRGVVVSAKTGQTTVILDGSTTAVPAFNYTHTQSLTANTVVRVLILNNQVEIIGAFPA